MKICCPGCGSNVRFEPKSQKLICEHCKKVSLISEIDIKKLDDEIRYSECKCSSCGSKLLVDDNSLITRCIYCGSNQLVKSKYNGEFKPTKIIPFKCDIKKFKYGFEEFIKGKNLANREFRRDTDNITNVVGVYVPFVVYELSANCKIDGQMVTTFDEVADKKSYNARYVVSEYNYEGTMAFDISEEFDNSRIDTIGPFNYENMVKFNPAYLCGFTAKAGDEEDLKGRVLYEFDKLTDSTLYARTTVADNKQIPSTYIYDYQEKGPEIKYEFNKGTKNFDLNIKEKTYVLVPVWFIDKRYKGQIYRYMMNGQTGKVYGEVPVNRNKLSLYLLNICAFPLFYMAYYFYKFNQDISIVFIALIIVIIGLIFADYFLYPKYIEKYKFISKRNLNINLREKLIEYKEIYKTDYFKKHGELKTKLLTASDNKDIKIKKETKPKYNID